LPSLIHASKQYNRLDCNNSQQQIDKDENYYRYWPNIPPSQSHTQQSTSNDIPQLHNQSGIVDDDDTTTYLSHSDRRKRLMNEYFNVSFYFSIL